jgi:hypothetical protein
MENYYYLIILFDGLIGLVRLEKKNWVNSAGQLFLDKVFL